MKSAAQEIYTPTENNGRLEQF